MKPTSLLQKHQRSVHLDFHTSPFVPDVGKEFDAEAFADTLARAHVNSVTIFAKCHHGMSYYPTKVGVMHPSLQGRDLLGEQIEALHRRGIRCPIYTTVAWEEHVATHHPEWRQMKSNGCFAQIGNAADFTKPTPGGWRFLNFAHPDYQDYIEAHVRELLDAYDVDGFFFDILFFDQNSCWSEYSTKYRAERGLLGTDRDTHLRFQASVQKDFAERFSAVVQGLEPEATVFYNGIAPHLRADSGLRSFEAALSHLELESLPSGFWGYFHFPRFARFAAQTKLPWMGMTGRFQRMWGDFGGLKPQPALEYECFRAQAMGGASSVGDQLPPRGTLDPAAYDLIGAVYEQWEQAEPFYAGSAPYPQVGILMPSDDVAVEGAIQACDEAHYDSVVLDETSDPNGLQVLILPDRVEPTPGVRSVVKRHLEQGGKLLISFDSGFEGESFELPGVELTFEKGLVDEYPTYWRSSDGFDAGLARSERVVYSAGRIVREQAGWQVLARRVLPYFKRTDLKFCSHFQAPPMEHASEQCAVLANEQVVYFADPVFAEYRRSGNIAVRDGVHAALRRLIGPAPVGAGLPTTVLSVPRRRGNDLIVSLLHYVPLRKALEIDVCEERMSLAGEVLRIEGATGKTARVFGGDDLPQRADGEFELPSVKGRLLVEVPGYFG